MMETETSAPQKMVPCSAVRRKRDPEGWSYLSGCVFSLEMQPPSGASTKVFQILGTLVRTNVYVGTFTFVCKLHVHTASRCLGAPHLRRVGRANHSSHGLE
ncbi:unnamed protein product [Rangifer tarandus platyrhynchus]|uniref:Uncharacterized protein n=1 Tax=Rangifer tarandus platyrhynchus TaxID=3082113 RepID=A0AC59YEI1_RANTA